MMVIASTLDGPAAFDAETGGPAVAPDGDRTLAIHETQCPTRRGKSGEPKPPAARSSSNSYSGSGSGWR